MQSPLPILRLANRPMVWLGWAWVTWMFVVGSSPWQSEPDLSALSWSDPQGAWFWRLVIAFPSAAFILLYSVIGDARTSTVVPVFMGAMIGFNRAPVLRFGATYPLSRRRRATVAYLGVVSTILAGLVLALAIVAILGTITQRFQADWPRLGRSMFLILPFVPVMIVPRLRANIRTSGRETMLAIAIGLASLLVLSMLTKRILDQLDDPVAIAALVATAIAAPQVYLWFRLRRFYTTGDLA